MLPGYSRRTFRLGPDPDGEGELEATLVRRDGAEPTGRHAVLLVHGYTDYFFHTEVADHFAARGFACFALDLHKCGRSHRPGQTPHFTTDLARYDAELELAVTTVTAETGADVLVCAHSAGGLVVSLWLDRLRRAGRTAALGLTGLVLNSPFLDLHGPSVLRSAPTAAALKVMARMRARSVVRRPREGGYGTSLHRDYGGEFDYDLTWKPIGGFPVTFGWLHAIRRGQAQLHRGLDVGVPNLILRSDHTVGEVADPQLMQRGDAVLDVAQIARWAGCIGNRSTVAPIADAKHDVFLSLAEPRAAAFAELDRWLDWYLTDHLGAVGHPTPPQERRRHG